jgi:hypothetical protein
MATNEALAGAHAIHPEIGSDGTAESAQINMEELTKRSNELET